jgi:hypothetical protein
MIAIQTPNTAGYLFKTFDTYSEFRAWHLETPDSSHYEVIQGRQNLYFDFDGDPDIDALTNAIRHYYTELEKTTNRSLPIRIDIYSSSDSVKKSFHVVVKGVCFRDHTSCGQAAREIIAYARRTHTESIRSEPPHERQMCSGWIDAFDGSVYSAKRNLRLLGSRKLNSTRVKIFAGTSYRSPTYASRFEDDQLFLSLIGVTSECQLVLLEQSEILPVPKTWGRQLAPEAIRDAILLMNDLLPGVFSQREVRGRTLFLRRNKPAICPICDRLHTSDNAMVSQRHDGLYFICLRDTSRSLALQSDEEVILPLIGSVAAQASRDPNGVAAPKRSAIELYAEKVVRRWVFMT